MTAMPPGDMFDDLAGIFAAIRQHVTAEQIDLHALEAPPLLAVREDAASSRSQVGLQECHGE